MTPFEIISGTRTDPPHPPKPQPAKIATVQPLSAGEVFSQWYKAHVRPSAKNSYLQDLFAHYQTYCAAINAPTVRLGLFAEMLTIFGGVRSYRNQSGTRYKLSLI